MSHLAAEPVSAVFTRTSTAGRVDFLPLGDSTGSIYVSELPTSAAAGSNYLVQDDGSTTSKVTVSNAVASVPLILELSNRFQYVDNTANPDFNDYTKAG